MKAMLAVSITCVHQILPEFVGGEFHQILIAIPKFDINWDIWPMSVPNPPIHLMAISLLDVAHMVRERGGANTP